MPFRGREAQGDEFEGGVMSRTSTLTPRVPRRLVLFHSSAARAITPVRTDDRLEPSTRCRLAQSDEAEIVIDERFEGHVLGRASDVGDEPVEVIDHRTCDDLRQRPVVALVCPTE